MGWGRGGLYTPTHPGERKTEGRKKSGRGAKGRKKRADKALQYFSKATSILQG